MRLCIVILFVLVVGCGDNEQRYHPGECEAYCFKVSLDKLSSIDHAQPSGAALEVIADVCRRTSDPCCGWDDWCNLNQVEGTR